MNNKTKYDINNFYVGRLSMYTHHTENLLDPYLSEEDSKNFDLALHTLSNGAIHLNEQDYFNWGNHNNYWVIFTIFYKKNEKYICLHNGLEYNLSQNVVDNCCFDLKKLTTVFPKFGFIYPKDISIEEALVYFTKIANCNKKTINKFYCKNKEKYSLNNFYVGTLNLYGGFCQNYSDKKRVYTNILEEKMLVANGAWQGCFGIRDDKDDYGIDYESHNWNMFTSLFMIANDGMYNIHDFKIYPNGILDKKSFQDYEIGDSFYEHMEPFKEFLNKKNIKYKDDNITINKVLKLYQKANKNAH